MLAQIHRFHGHNSLNFTYKQGSVLRGSYINLKYARNDRRTTYRVAVVVSKKISKSAVVRNRIRRRIYEVVRLQAIAKPYDLIFMVYGLEVATLPADQLQKSITSQLSKAGVI
jgi:ribonuclease P protein component